MRICEHLGVPVSDTVGFGDSMNDLEMIQTVGTSVCMANGSDALKKISDIVCPSVEEDGMAKAFAQLGAGLKALDILHKLARPILMENTVYIQ